MINRIVTNARNSKYVKFLDSKRFKQSLSLFGMGLGLLGLVIILGKFWEYSNKIGFSTYSFSTWSTFIIFAFIYCGFSFLLPFAWHNILRFLGLDVQLYWSSRTYGLSQLAKYVPGNIFQFASRQAIGVSDGVPGLTLAKSIIWELAIMAIAGFFFGILILPRFFKGLSNLNAFFGYFLIMPIVFIIARFGFHKRVAYSFGLYSLFLFLASLIFYLVIFTILPEQEKQGLPVILICGTYVVAWLIGLITPGAPAGAGIRELVLFVILQTQIPQQFLLPAILITRMVTICGDILFFCSGVIMKKMEGNRKSKLI